MTARDWVRARRRWTSGRGHALPVALAVVAALAFAAPAEAAVISPGGPPVTVDVPTSGDTAVTTFDGTPGQRVSLEITAVSIGTTTCCTTKVSILTPAAKTLASLVVGTTGGFIDTVALPADGTYSVVVDPSSTNTGSATLTLHDVPPDLTGTIAAGGPSVAVDLGTPGQNARLTFPGTAGQRVSVETGNVTIGNSTCCSAKLSLVKPDGKVLSSTTFGSTGAFLDATTLPAGGTYTLLVDAQGPAVGSATVALGDVPPDVVASMAPDGPPVTVTTTVAGQNARVTFVGTAARRVSLALSGVCCNTRVMLLRPDGRTLASTSVGTFGGFLDATTLPTTGTYTILVDPQGSGTGSVTLTLYDVPPDVTGTLAPGGPPVTVQTAVPGQNAAVTFAGAAGQRVSVVVSDACCAMRVTLLRPNGATLATTTAGTFGGFLDATTLPTSGTYTIVVDPQGSATGSMTLRAYDVPSDPTATIAAGGPPASVTTTVPGQNARLTFAGTAGQRVSLKIGPTCCSAMIAIVRPGGSTLATTTASSSGGYLDTTLLPVSGTYTIVVDVQGAATGTVALTLYDVPADVTGAIVPGGAAVTVVTSVPGQNARLTFTGTANQRVSVALTDACCATTLSVVKPDGSTLASITTFGPGGFVDTQRLPASGTYTIVVDPSGQATGSMTLTLYDVPPDATGTLVPDGPPVTVTFGTPGQNARLTFDGSAGRRVSLAVSNVSIGSSLLGGARVSILKPDGTELVTPITVGTSGGTIDPVTLPVTGTYTVVVDPIGSATGSATLTLHDVPTDVTASIVPGGPAVTVTMASPGQNALVTFTGSAGQRVSLELLNVSIGGSPCCSAKLSLLEPGGATLASIPSFGTSGAFLDATTLPVAGTYTILVDPQGTATGSADLRLYDVPPDATAAATPGGSAVTVSTSTAGQNAAVTFAGTVGQRVSLRIGPSCCIEKVTMLAPGGAMLFGPTSFGTGGGFVDTESLLANGTYTVLLDPAGLSTGSTTVTVYDVPPDVTGSLAPGSSLTLTTSVPGQNASATFTGAADTGIKLTVGPFNCCSTQVSILAPDGTTQVPVTSFNPDGGVVLTRLGAAGTYTIVTDPQGPNVGVLHLSLELDTSAPAPPVLTLTESSPDEHVVGSSLYYRPGGAGGAFVVGATSSDAGAGLQKIRFPGLAGGFTPTSPVDDTLSPYSQTFSWTTNATYENATNLVTAFDRVGNTSSTSFGVFPDSTPPTTTDNTAAIGSGWKNTTQFVNLSATDGGGAGAAVSYYTSDGSTPTTASAQGTSVTLSPEGVYTVKYFSVDYVGNVESVKTAATQVQIDKTSPSAAVLDPLPATIRNGQVLTGSGSDALSGVGSIAYYYCAGSACTPSVLIGSSSSGSGYPLTWSGQPADGTYQLVARVVDVAGNTLDSAKRTVAIDNTAPNTTITSQPGNPTNQTSAAFAFSATETGSTFECRLDGAAFASCSSPKTYSGLAAGSHTFEVRATDPVGNSDMTPASFTWTIDLIPPDTTIIAAPADPTNSTAPSFSFTSSESGSTFQCSLDGGAYASCSSPKTYSGLAPGTHTFQVRATDPAGNTDATPSSHTWTIDTAAPDTTITSGAASPTNSTAASFSFTSSEAGATFQCSLDGAAFTACTTPKTYAGLAAGAHTFQVRAIDQAGNVDPTPAAENWTVDVTPPDTSVSSGPANPTKQTSATLAFTATEAGSTFECSLDGAAFTPCSSPISYLGLAAGAHGFQVKARDAAGNIDPTPASYSWTIDLAAPDTVVSSGPASPTNQTSATFTFTATEAGSTFGCSLDGGAFTACTTPKTYAGLAAGAHTFEVRATDAAGNTDQTPASHGWTIDTAAPDTAISSGPASPTNQTGATFVFTATETGSTFECRLDGASFASCTTPKTYAGLTAGAHSFDVRAVDPAGNADPTPASYSWTIDVAAPDTVISSGPASPTNQTSATFAFTATEAGSTFECRLDGGAFTACTTPKTYAGLAAGAHTFEVRATDPAGNTDQTPASDGWTIDMTPPETSIDAGPADPTNQTSAVFSFSAGEAGSTFECRLDGAAFASCASSKTYTGLAAGTHTFEVRAVDPAGNADPTPASYSWTIDATPPDTTIVSGPSDPTNQTSASFAFDGSEVGATFECNLDFGGWAPCTSPKPYGSLAAGSHSFQVRATDPAGNTDPTPAGRTWVVDLSAPETAVLSAPPAETNQTAATFDFSANEGGSTFECRLDAAAFAPCASPTTYSGLAEGSHTFEVRATDPAGNTDPTPAIRNWGVDLTAPAAPLVESPADGSHMNTGTIVISGTAEPGSSVEVFEGAASRGTTNATAGGSWSKTLTGLADGSHTYTARATDAAGNTSATSNAITIVVDTAAPNTTIGTGPLGSTKNTSATFSFSADDPAATFECSLDGTGYTSCTSPKTYTGLTEGSHTFEVRAIDTAGNTDPTPAARTWAVDLTAPAAPEITSPADGSTNRTGAITLSGTAEPGSIVTVFEGATSKGTTTATGAGAWSRALTGVADGSHTYTAKATDVAGNPSAASAGVTVVVDTIAPETSISTGPAGPTSATDATFAFAASEAGSTFECSLDGAAFSACASPAPYTGLAEGSHTFEVRATDAAGNTDSTPAARTWTVDVSAPQTIISSGPTDPSGPDATFEFSADEGGSLFECSLDGGGFVSCTSPQNYAGLAAGQHTFEVRATDPAGNGDGTPASYAWTVS
jgi:uncharacterized protein YhfF